MQLKEFESVFSRIQPEGFALENHLMALLRYVDEKGREDEPIDLEKLSLFLKEHQFEFTPKIPGQGREGTTAGAERTSTTAKTGPEVVMRPDCFVEDLDSKLAALEALGKGFTKFETLKLAEALKKTAADPTVGEVHFFGKVLGTSGDYFVIWTNAKTAHPNGDVLESVGFRVSPDCETWTKLPPITAKTVRQSRHVKAFFTGKLDHQVAEGLKEAEYLHAVLFRVLFSNVLAPDGFLILQGDSESIVERSPEFKLTADAVRELGGWIHRFPPVMKYGNTYHPWAQEEEVAQRMEATDPPGKPLSALTPETDTRKWEVRVVAGNAAFVSGEDGQGKKGTDVVGITNDVWPGALNFYSEFEEVFGFVYIGFGVKGPTAQAVIESKVAPVSQDIMKVGLKDFKEPNPDEGQEVLETDSEPEKNGDEDKNDAD